MTYEHKDYSHEPWADKSWVIPLLNCTNPDKQFVGGTPAEGANYFYANRALDLDHFTREDLNNIWKKYSGMINFEADFIQRQRDEAIRKASLHHVKIIKEVIEEQLSLHHVIESEDVLSSPPSIQDEVVHVAHASCDSTSQTWCKPNLPEGDITSTPKETKAYEPSKYGYDMSEFTSGKYLPWKKSREIDPVEGVAIPLWLLGMPTQVSVDGFVKVEISCKLETCIRQAWESPEWQANEYTKPRKGRNVEKQKQAFIEKTLYLYNHSRHYRNLPIWKIKDVFSTMAQAQEWIDLIQTQYTHNDKLYTIMKYIQSGQHTNKPNYADWDTYFYSATVIIEKLTNRTLLKDAEGYYMWAKRLCSSHPVLLRDQEMFREMVIPDRVLVEARLDHLVSTGYEYKGRVLTSETKTPRPNLSPNEAEGKSPEAKLLRQLKRLYVWEEDWMQTYDNACDHTRLTLYSKHRDRHYGPYIELASEIRSMFLWRGKRLTWLDYSSMHPTLLLLRFMDQSVPVGYEEQFMTECALITRILGFSRDVIAEPVHDPRVVMMEIYNEQKALGNMEGIDITCKKLKIAQLSFYNQKISSASHTDLSKFYDKMMPMFSAWLRDIKGLGDSNHKTVSRWLLHKEAELMEAVVTTIRSVGIDCIMAHDGVDVDPDKAWQAEQIFRQVCVNHNLPPNITMK